MRSAVRFLPLVVFAFAAVVAGAVAAPQRTTSLRLEKVASGTGQRRESFTVANLSSFAQDAAGELYLVSLDGVVYRLAA